MAITINNEEQLITAAKNRLNLYQVRDGRKGLQSYIDGEWVGVDSSCTEELQKIQHLIGVLGFVKTITPKNGNKPFKVLVVKHAYTNLYCEQVIIETDRYSVSREFNYETAKSGKFEPVWKYYKKESYNNRDVSVDFLPKDLPHHLKMEIHEASVKYYQELNKLKLGEAKIRNSDTHIGVTLSVTLRSESGSCEYHYYKFAGSEILKSAKHNNSKTCCVVMKPDEVLNFVKQQHPSIEKWEIADKCEFELRGDDFTTELGNVEFVGYTRQVHNTQKPEKMVTSVVEKQHYIILGEVVEFVDNIQEFVTKNTSPKSVDELINLLY